MGAVQGAMARVYEYDVFISYKRRDFNVPAWIRTHFYPRLLELLDNNLDRDVKIFFDESVPGGDAWPLTVRDALRHARILVPVCSPKYFLDEWCLAEWHSMAKREQLTGMATPSHPQGLIYPVIFCDSDNFPKYAKDRRMHDLKPWNQPWPQFQDTIAYLDFYRQVERIAVELVRLFDTVPSWRPDWPVDTADPEPPATPRLPRF
ncbi:MAG TPA: toll/interleukin-1 receptor domain-containing protein [Pseudonocardiaceae bacterium]|nr:toll/interleukin-1 receptor domain-containing protein [Pseudonocardiaceae bacterium]